MTCVGPRVESTESVEKGEAIAEIRISREQCALKSVLLRARLSRAELPACCAIELVLKDRIARRIAGIPPSIAIEIEISLLLDEGC